MNFPAARGAIFDLDGTLMDSGLDFEQMRREMELPPRRPILEAIADLPPDRAAVCWRILERHEREGAEQATILPGVPEFLGRLSARGLKRGVLTRNSRSATLASLARLGTEFDTIVAREDAPPKPDPQGIWKICDAWGLAPSEVAMIGDYRFDLEAARGAGARAVLFVEGQQPADYADFPPADYVLPSFLAGEEFLAWLAEPI